MENRSVKIINPINADENTGRTATTEKSAGVAAMAISGNDLADAAAAGSTSAKAAEATMRCPACRAQQVWSLECRRCGADLTLLRQFENTSCHQRRLALTALRDGRNQVATRHASRLYQLRPDADSTRLLAVCLLMSGQFAHACRIANMGEFSE